MLKMLRHLNKVKTSIKRQARTRRVLLRELSSKTWKILPRENYFKIAREEAYWCSKARIKLRLTRKVNMTERKHRVKTTKPAPIINSLISINRATNHISNSQTRVKRNYTTLGGSSSSSSSSLLLRTWAQSIFKH